MRPALHNNITTAAHYCYNYSTKLHVSALLGHHQAYKTVESVKVHSVALHCNTLLTHTQRHGTIQFRIQASQARSIYQYKKCNIKVLKRNADIFFSKTTECTLTNSADF